MTVSVRALMGVAGLLLLSPPSLLWAAELAATAVEAPAGVQTQADCGPCGCLEITQVYHPDIRSTYGLGYDPRNYDATQPHFYLGRVRAYPRYSVDGVAAGRPSC